MGSTFHGVRHNCSSGRHLPDVRDLGTGLSVGVGRARVGGSVVECSFGPDPTGLKICKERSGSSFTDH